MPTCFWIFLLLVNCRIMLQHLVLTDAHCIVDMTFAKQIVEELMGRSFNKHVSKFAANLKTLQFSKQKKKTPFKISKQNNKHPSNFDGSSDVFEKSVAYDLIRQLTAIRMSRRGSRQISFLDFFGSVRLSLDLCMLCHVKKL